jgi:hypothetical protein
LARCGRTAQDPCRRRATPSARRANALCRLTGAETAGIQGRRGGSSDGDDGARLLGARTCSSRSADAIPGRRRRSASGRLQARFACAAEGVDRGATPVLPPRVSSNQRVMRASTLTVTTASSPGRSNRKRKQDLTSSLVP